MAVPGIDCGTPAGTVNGGETASADRIACTDGPLNGAICTRDPIPATGVTSHPDPAQTTSQDRDEHG